MKFHLCLCVLWILFLVGRRLRVRRGKSIFLRHMCIGVGHCIMGLVIETIVVGEGLLCWQCHGGFAWMLPRASFTLSMETWSLFLKIVLCIRWGFMLRKVLLLPMFFFLQIMAICLDAIYKLIVFIFWRIWQFHWSVLLFHWCWLIVRGSWLGV